MGKYVNGWRPDDQRADPAPQYLKDAFAEVMEPGITIDRYKGTKLKSGETIPALVFDCAHHAELYRLREKHRNLSLELGRATQKIRRLQRMIKKLKDPLLLAMEVAKDQTNGHQT